MFGKKWVLRLLGPGTVLLFFVPYFVFAENGPSHSETIVVLKGLYEDEITACRTYAAFCQKAQKEGYLNVAKLFLAFRASEEIHARNFKQILQGLGVSVKDVPETPIEVSDSKANLKYALSTELAEIDEKYPEYINRTKPEGHKAAVDHIIYAWKSEKQHRDHIRKMQVALPFFFGIINQKLGKMDTYFVCEKCGSTVSELPEKACPICERLVSMYQEIEGLEQPGKELK